MSNAAAIAAAFGGGLPPGISGTNDRCTIIAANLNSDKVDEDKLFNLFSLYGNIVRIKFLPNKPDHALIEMEDGFQAELAVHFLKGALLFGKKLEVNYSKYSNITPAPDTHQYSGSSLNRFNRNAAKNYRHCCVPTKMIHISTLPHDISRGARNDRKHRSLRPAGRSKLWFCSRARRRLLEHSFASMRVKSMGIRFVYLSLSCRAYRSNLCSCFGERSDYSF